MFVASVPTDVSLALHYSIRGGGCIYLKNMEKVDVSFLQEEQYRILMCHRIAKTLDLGKIVVDLTTHKCRWFLEKHGEVKEVFRSLDEMESYLEKTFEKKRISPRKRMNSAMQRRANIIAERRLAEEENRPMIFSSRINKICFYET